MALELRKAGGSYREIAQQLGVDVHTAHGDVGAELAALREKTAERAAELRTLELERLDAMNVGLWPQIRAGSPPAVTAAIRVSERRARLLGLDEPLVTKNELSGSLGVYAERLAIERDLYCALDVTQLEELAAASQALVDRAMAMVAANARSAPMPVRGSLVAESTAVVQARDITSEATTARGTLVEDEGTPESAEMSPHTDISEP